MQGIQPHVYSAGSYIVMLAVFVAFAAIVLMKLTKAIIVISGPIYGSKPKRIGDNKVAVPDGFFKIVYDPGMQRVLAFYFDNKPYPKAKLDASYLISVSEVEEKTGLQLFSALDKRARKRVKSSKGALWR
jgi:endonuclease G